MTTLILSIHIISSLFLMGSTVLQSDKVNTYLEKIDARSKKAILLLNFKNIDSFYITTLIFHVFLCLFFIALACVYFLIYLATGERFYNGLAEFFSMASFGFLWMFLISPLAFGSIVLFKKNYHYLIVAIVFFVVLTIILKSLGIPPTWLMNIDSLIKNYGFPFNIFLGAIGFLYISIPFMIGLIIVSFGLIPINYILFTLLLFLSKTIIMLFPKKPSVFIFLICWMVSLILLSY